MSDFDSLLVASEAQSRASYYTQEPTHNPRKKETQTGGEKRTNCSLSKELSPSSKAERKQRSRRKQGKYKRLISLKMSTTREQSKLREHISQKMIYKKKKSTLFRTQMTIRIYLS